MLFLESGGNVLDYILF